MELSAGKVLDPRPVLLESGDFSTIFTARERRFPARVAKFFFGSGFFQVTKLLACQLSSRTRVRPSPSGISLGCQAGLTPSPPSSLKLRRSRRLRRARWSKHSGSAPVGSLSWLNQFRPGSSSGIPSLMAYQITRSGRFAGLLVGGGAERRR